MPTNDYDLQTQAREILDTIAFIPFDQCQALSREFTNIPPRPGIYAIRHKTDGLYDVRLNTCHYVACFSEGVRSDSEVK